MVSWRYFFVVCSLSASFFGAAVPTTLPYKKLIAINYGFGHELACQEIQDLVRVVQKELGMESYTIEVRRFSENRAEEHSQGAAFEQSHLFFNEEKFLAMPRDEQRFLIGHELIHVRNSHKKKENFLENLIAYGGSALIFIAVGRELKDNWQYLSDAGKDDAIKASIGAWAIGSLASVFVGCCCGLSSERSHEEEADCYAAHELHCALGGCSFFLKEILKSGDTSTESGFFDSHPKLLVRFINLALISGDVNLMKLVTDRGDKAADVYLKNIQDYLESQMSKNA